MVQIMWIYEHNKLKCYSPELAEALSEAEGEVEGEASGQRKGLEILRLCLRMTGFLVIPSRSLSSSAAKGPRVNSVKDLADKQCCIYNGIVNTGDNDKNEK
jgi:hypothetical protein